LTPEDEGIAFFQNVTQWHSITSQTLEPFTFLLSSVPALLRIQNPDPQVCVFSIAMKFCILVVLHDTPNAGKDSVVGTATH
jgi:hypothetical protein